MVLHNFPPLRNENDTINLPKSILRQAHRHTIVDVAQLEHDSIGGRV